MPEYIFRTIRELLDSRHDVMAGNAVSFGGALYEHSVENLNALRMLEPLLIELVRECLANGHDSKALREVIELLEWEEI